MNLAAILLCLLSLPFLSVQSLSHLSPSPSPSKAPIDAICDLFKEYENEMAYKYCVAFFHPYPSIHKATSHRIALIANNVAKQRADTLINTIETYLSNSKPNESAQEGLGSCTYFLQSEAIPTIQNTMHLIMKREYYAAFDAGKRIFSDKFSSACSIDDMREENEIKLSYVGFVMAEDITYATLAFITGHLVSTTK